MENKFTGKVAVITGFNRGISKAIAVELAREGASVVLNGRDSERLKLAQKDIEKYKHKIHVGLIYVGMTEIEYHKETIASKSNF